MSNEGFEGAFVGLHLRPPSVCLALWVQYKHQLLPLKQTEKQTKNALSHCAHFPGGEKGSCSEYSVTNKYYRTVSLLRTLGRGQFGLNSIWLLLP